jgi:hypothetical protein
MMDWEMSFLTNLTPLLMMGLNIIIFIGDVPLAQPQSGAPAIHH